MINYAGIPFSEEAKRKIEQSEINYKRFANIVFIGTPGYDVEGRLRLEVIVRQTAPATNGKVLTKEELEERGLAAFDGLVPDGYTVLIQAGELAQ